MLMLWQMGKKKLGLALGSGGLRGAAHIGVLRSLERHGFYPDLLSGSSAGAVVAALYAAGYGVGELAELACKLNAGKIYDPNLGFKAFINRLKSLLGGGGRLPQALALPAGLLKGEAWQKYLASLLGRQLFSDLRLPLAVLAVDIEDGASIIFSGQPLPTKAETLVETTVVEALRASTAIPGIFQPAQVGGHNLVDGAVKASVPVYLARLLGADLVLAVDLGYAGQRRDKIDNFMEIILQSINIMGAALTDCQLRRVPLVVQPQIYDVSLWDFKRIPEIIDRGEEAMEAKIPELQKLLAI